MHKAMKRLRLLLLSVIALTSIACSQRPSESEARQMLESSLMEQLNVEVQVLNFRKTNGLAEVVDGAKHYIMEYEAEFVFPKGYDPYKPGEGYKKENGRLRFVKTEKGWRLEARS